MAKISFRLPDTLENTVRKKLQISNYSCMSELLRDLLRKWIEHNTIEITLPNIERQQP